MNIAMKKILLLTTLILCTGSMVDAQNRLPYQNPSLPIPDRVKDLIGRMTPEEKFWQLFMIPGDLGSNPDQFKNGLFGFQVSAALPRSNTSGQILQYDITENALTLAKKINSIQHYFVEKTRLGIPMIAFDESLHGLVRSGATSFPQAIGLAASFDTGLMHRVAAAIALETKSRGIRQVLTPVVNIASDVRWGRTEETYGEDPFLASEMAVAFVSPFEQSGVITTPKHFVANVGEGGRDSYPIHLNERILDEIYLPPFLASIQRGGSRSIMTAYNSVDGSPASANDWLLNRKLKNDWQFKGFVISDASAVGGANVLHYTAKDYPEAGKKSITNGLDVIFQTAYDHYQLFIPPFLNGQIAGSRIYDAVSRVLTAKFELGLFEHPYVSEEKAAEWSHNVTHKLLAKEAAVKSMVLLKNQNKQLPLSKKIHSITIIGENAAKVRLGGYSGPGNGTISILKGIQEKLGKEVAITYIKGPGREDKKWTVIPTENLKTVMGGKSVNGMAATYFADPGMKGQPMMERIDPVIDFSWTLFSPDTSLAGDQYAVRWEGKLKAPATGRYAVGVDGNDGYRLFINGKLVIDQWEKQSYHTRLIPFYFEEGKLYDIRLLFNETAGNAHIRLIWNYGIPNDTEKNIQEAVEAAGKSDAVLVVAGIREGEFQDRASLDLPGNQGALIQRVAATGKPVTVVLVGGSAITMQNWIDRVGAILDVWYPGEEGGHAIADVLFGDANPSGKLPVTFPQSAAQLPMVYNHKPTGRGDDYTNLSGLPLFPFGFGMSYTHFTYSQIHLTRSVIPAGDSVLVSCKIRNDGERDGEEVVQLYIRDKLASVAQPVLALKGFQRIALRAGETRQVSFLIKPEMLEMLNEKMERVIEPGEFRIMIGASSRALWLKDTLLVIDK